MSSSRTRVVCIKVIWFPATYTGCNGLGSGLGSNVERGFDGMGILRVFCVYDTIGNRCFEKTSFPKMVDRSVDQKYEIWAYIKARAKLGCPLKQLMTELQLLKDLLVCLMAQLGAGKMNLNPVKSPSKMHQNQVGQNLHLVKKMFQK